MLKYFTFLNLFLNVFSENCSDFHVWCEKSNKCVSILNDVCECTMNDCNMECELGFKKDNNGCDLCECNIICPIKYAECDDYVCPKVIEISSCLIDNLNGYTTYELSLVINENSLARNIFAIFGNEVNLPHHMTIPPAYQIDGFLGSNLGGVPYEMIQINPNSAYDSWLTVGITDGDLDNKVSTVGIDFSEWSLTNGLNINNGAVFLMDPEEEIVSGNEYVIAQLTISDNQVTEVVLNAQGKKKDLNSDAWVQTDIHFQLDTVTSIIPSNCELWFDGCNSCIVINNQIDTCTELACQILNTPHCLRYITGH